MNYISSIFILLLGIATFTGCGSNTKNKENNQSSQVATKPAGYIPENYRSLHNSAAYVTSQCYTKTESTDGTAHNPCFSCHINSIEPNYIDDPDLQAAYDFSDYTATNRFTNLFKDRTQAVEAISDNTILEYVRQNNYIKDNKIILANKLQSNLPAEWDFNGDKHWDGYMPDCYFNFDSEGFDKTPSDTYTGWRAFAYYPFLGTFWPTNGSTDDVMIRLHEVFQQNENQEFNLEVYKINLAIVEALIKRKDIEIQSVDETKYGVDLDQNGVLGNTTLVKYNWTKPSYDSATGKISNFSMSYVGHAKTLLETNEYLIAPGLYPKNTEFLHSVRYIDIDQNNSITMAPRMKELRYGKKTNWNTYSQLQKNVLDEIKERDLFPDRLRTILGNTEEGLQTGIGWTYQGFIEDANGELRPQNYEETQYCIGCHSGIGAIADSTFVFQRKFDHSSQAKGWYHWTQSLRGLKDVLEPQTKDGRDEYTLYLEANGAGDEFRSNTEVMEKFFETNGSLKQSEVTKMHTDISHLILPSPQRALELNKAYKVIVDEQSYIYGRDAHVAPVTNVHKSVKPSTATGVDIITYSN